MIANFENRETIAIALSALRLIIRKQLRTIQDVASIRKMEAKTSEEKAAIDRWVSEQSFLLLEHFDPSAFRNENPFMCTEEQKDALRAFAKSMDVERWLLSNKHKNLDNIQVIIYASRIRQIVAMSIAHSDLLMSSAMPLLDRIALECAVLARINYGKDEVVSRTKQALVDLIAQVDGAYVEVLCDGERMGIDKACMNKFIRFAALCIKNPEAAVLQWLERSISPGTSRKEALDFVRKSLKPLGEEERKIVNDAFIKFTEQSYDVRNV